MKKILYILVGVGLTVGALATAGFVYAQTEDPVVETPGEMPFESGSRRGRKGTDMFGGLGFGDGLLSEYLFPALADIFGFTDDQVDGFQVVKDTIQDIRETFTVAEIREKMQAAFTSAVENALADGTITQEQADQMLERREQLGDRDFDSFEGRFEDRGMRDGFMPEGFTFEGRMDGMLQEYMDLYLAEALDISVEELQVMKEDGFNLRDYAAENGLSPEELAEMMAEVNTNAINAALEDGAITQEQADWMLEAMGKFGTRMPFGTDFGGGMRGGRNGEN
jgi:hypothetical protein